MKKMILQFKEKLWVTPAIYILISIALSIGFYYVDLLYMPALIDFIPSILLTNVDLAKTIMGSLSGALLTMTTFTFSTILVVLTMYSSQFSPRTLKNFIHDKVVWRVLGIFLSGFIYNTLSLLFMREDLYETDVISTFVGIVIAFFCLSTFAYFIHYIATNVQVGQLVNQLILDTEESIEKIEKLQEDEASRKEDWQPIGIKETYRAENEGYVHYIDFKKLINCAEENEMKIEILINPGDYIYEGKAIFHMYGTNEDKQSVGDFYALGTSRTAEQDLDFALKKMVEVALRAISPGINDPNTANDIIIRMGRLLGQQGQLKTGPFVLGDNNVLYRFPSYKETLYKIFHQLSHYGKEDISVLIAILESLNVAAEVGPEMHHQDLWDIHHYVVDGIDVDSLKQLDCEALQTKIDELAAAANKHSYNLLSLKEKY